MDTANAPRTLTPEAAVEQAHHHHALAARAAARAEVAAEHPRAEQHHADLAEHLRRKSVGAELHYRDALANLYRVTRAHRTA